MSTRDFDWGGPISDLLALGGRVDPEQAHVLQHGGEVLAAVGLPSPWWFEGDTSVMRDENGDAVFAPMLFEAVSPNATDFWYPYGENRDNQRVWEFLEQHEGGRWRYWPSYVGTATGHFGAANFFCCYDDLSWVRVWAGVVIKDEYDRRVADEVMSGVCTWISNTTYEAEMLIAEFCTYGEAPLAPVVEAPESELVEVCREWDIDPDEAQGIRTAYADLQAAGIVSADDYRTVADHKFGMVENFLTPTAAAMWRRLLARQANTIGRICTALPTYAAQRFLYDEGFDL